ncbi:MAG: PTS sugar transporter subunit IIA [Planctomycetes bacterium]|nr:PTS sugar transporter subunit IIA [Planctomycetota bacterium]
MPARISLSPAARLTDVFCRGGMMVGLTARNRDEIVAEMISRLVETGHIDEANQAPLIKAVLARELMGSTALGNGIAFPHCRTSLVNDFVGCIAVDRDGVGFQSLDRSPVHAVFLLIGPLDRREQFFDILARISGLGRNTAWRYQLRSSRSPDDITSILEEIDAG